MVLQTTYENMANSKTTFVIFGGFVTAVVAAFYPIFFHPLSHADEYKRIQSENRAEISQADVQPVGVKVWSDPFKPKS